MSMNEVISRKYGWNTTIWTKIMHLGHQVKDLLGVKIRTSCKNSKPTWAKFWEFDFFLSEKTRLYSQLVIKSSSCINFKMKLLIKLYLLDQKQWIIVKNNTGGVTF